MVLSKPSKTIASLYAGSVNQDVFESRARGSHLASKQLFTEISPSKRLPPLIDTST